MKIGKFAQKAVAFTLLSAVAATASAIPMIQLSGDGTGTFSYDGAGGAFTGNGIGFDTATVLGTDFSDEPSNCGACSVSFATGGNVAEDTSLGGTFTFEDGGFIDFTGSNGLSATGAFTGTPTITVTGDGTGTFSAMGVLGDFSEGLNDYFSLVGLDPTTPYAFEFDFAGTADSTPDGILSNGQVTTASFTVTPVAEPEQLAMFLLGAALIGVGVSVRKKNAQNTVA